LLWVGIETLVSESTPPRRPVLSLDDLARPVTRRPERIQALGAAELAIAFSQGLDMGEGKMVGHAQRVCYIAVALAEAMELAPEQRAGVYFGALLHDAGVTLAASDVCRIAGIDEDSIFGPSPLKTVEEMRSELTFADLTALIEAMHQHCTLGAETVRALELPEEAAQAVLGHHERWDGLGFPEGVAGEKIPVEARIVAAADHAESLIAREPSSLAARRNLPGALGRLAGTSLDPSVVGKVLECARSDEFWLGLYPEDMTETLQALRPAVETRKSRRRAVRFAEVFADISDAKGGHTTAHSRRTADAAVRLAEALELEPGHVELIRLAALLHNVGMLGVPARIMSKPDILSVAEMQLMRQHPANSEVILQDLLGFEEVSIWIARHHERPDGKGYPEMLTGDEIPMEARLIAVADVYTALTADRAHRKALSRRDAKQVLLGAAGTQLDAELARRFVDLI
jgi:HD-GYP domain-containing protein (c-di-GMP phosphodiesterase class II)